MRIETKNASEFFDRACRQLAAIDERREKQDSENEAAWRASSWWRRHFPPPQDAKPPNDWPAYPSCYAWGDKDSLERLAGALAFAISSSDSTLVIHLDDGDLDALGV